MAIHSRLGFLDPPSHIWQRSQKFQMHIIESGEVVKPLATLATLTNLPWNDAHNWKWRGSQNYDNLGTSDNLVMKWCTLYLLSPLAFFLLSTTTMMPAEQRLQLWLQFAALRRPPSNESPKGGKWLRFGLDIYCIVLDLLLPFWIIVGSFLVEIYLICFTLRLVFLNTL